MNLETVTLVHSNGFGIPQAMTGDDRRFLVTWMKIEAQRYKDAGHLDQFPYALVEVLLRNGMQEVFLLD